MQLIALEGEKRVIAGQAIKGQDYCCPECLHLLRIRSGPHRQPHFYHSRSPLRCRQYGKTLPHLHTQLYIQKLLPEGEAELEFSFPEINRIADVAWHAKKIVFEVQCSSISLEEVKERTLDYEQLGYRVVWILHEKRFNRCYLSGAEHFLTSRECYFTSIDREGQGIIYDQFQIIYEGKRLQKGPRLRVNPARPFLLVDYPLVSELPSQLIERETRLYGFEGDLLDRCRNLKEKEWISMRQMEQRYFKKKSWPGQLRDAFIWSKKFYLSFLDALLEKHTS